MTLATTALTTLATVKSDLGISVSTYDTTLEGVIGAATARIESYCRRPFARLAVADEAATGYGSTCLWVKRTPIDTSVAVTVKYDGDTVSTSAYEVQSAEAGLIRATSGVWTWDAAVLANSGEDPLPGTERALYEVSYTGGYITPGQATGGLTRNLPEDLEMACRVLACGYYRQLGRDPSIQSESLMSYSVQYINGGVFGSEGAQLPALVIGLLAPYRRYAE